MFLLSIFLPFFSFLTLSIFGKFVGKTGSQIISITLLFISFLFSLVIFKDVGLNGNIIIVKGFEWIKFDLFNICWCFYFDTLTSVMLIVVTFVSTLVHFYSVEYMRHDPHIIRFFSYLSLFTFFMLMLISGENMIQMFFGWEGVGLSSYLLINFWFTRLQANKAAMKAMIINRIGDFGLALGIICCFFLFKSINFTVMFPLTYIFKNESVSILNYDVNVLALISILVFVGAIGKSAQLGLHTWLPDAMEGPTPVSALIHAATMVTAGVFVLIKCSPFLEYAPKVLFFIATIGGLTAFFAATTGLVQNDLKKVIAYSTCSQLGYMVFACGLSNYSASMFHLANHAFFKALLFLSAGAIIHALSDEQDMRKMGGLYQYLPFTYVMILIGSLSLMGIPFMTGFYSKDLILELAYGKYEISGSFVYWLGVISAFFTAFYSFRLLYLTFLTPSNFHRKLLHNIHEAPFFMLLPLLFLCFGSIFIGYVAKDMMVGIGSDFFGNSICVLPENLTAIESEFLPTYIKFIPFVFTIIGAFIPFIISFLDINILFYTNVIFRSIYSFFNQKWYFDTIYNKFIVSSYLYFSYHISFKIIDRGIIELLGPLGIVRIVSYFSNNIKNIQSGMIHHYAFFMMFCFILLTFFSFNDILFELYRQIAIFGIKHTGYALFRCIIVPLQTTGYLLSNDGGGILFYTNENLGKYLALDLPLEIKVRWRCLRIQAYWAFRKTDFSCFQLVGNKSSFDKLIMGLRLSVFFSSLMVLFLPKRKSFKNQ